MNHDDVAVVISPGCQGRQRPEFKQPFSQENATLAKANGASFLPGC